MGAIAAFHAKSINNLPRARLLAISSRNAEKARLAAAEFGADYYSNFEKMLQRDDIDVVCICTASGYHLQPALVAARAGKHVIVEKPLEISLERCDEMIAACEKAGVKLTCIFQNRFNPDFIKIKQAFTSGKLGKPVLGSAYIKWFRPQEYYDAADWRGTLAGDGGAALINQSIHTIDLLLTVMGPVRSVYGKIATRTHKIEGEDLGLAVLQFKNGALGLIEGSTSIYPGYPERLEIHGEKGTAVLEGGVITRWDIAGEKSNIKGVKNNKSGASDPLVIPIAGHMAQIDDMIDAILENRAPVVDGREGRKALQVILAIYQASKSGKEIILST
ncbi:MAG: gfo/Idh/MocA family oxidoreductase [Calditrichaeota bacterium]|nr:MAG: gfo/Idh/MocA family oxidoreductase [Calditrichota bacterium]